MRSPFALPGLGLALVLAASPAALASPASDATDAAVRDRAADAAALAAVPDVASTAACQGGRFHCFARVVAADAGRVHPLAAGGLTAAQLQSAYALDPTIDPHATIAIVDAYNYPNAESDLAAYRSQMGLPPCTVASGCLTIVNQNGQASPLPTTAPAGDDWTVETALDLDMASAACPKCKLLLVLAQDDQGDGLFVAQGAAAAGAAAVSNSWGGPEQAGNPATASESYFNHPGVSIFVAAGDSGYDDAGQGPDYPGTSAYVTAVGGTTLTASGSARGWAEAAWSKGGSACSLSIPKPAWQTSTACAYKMTADVAAVGDPATGVAVYNQANGGFIVVGGTSAASPLVAGIYTLTGHAKEAPSFAYQNAAKFFDVTTGTNGNCGTILCKAGTGWDGPTGNGTPNGALLAQGAAGTDAPPTVAITSPSDGGGAARGFTVQVSASDDHGVAMVELYVDGALAGTSSTAPYSFATDASLADGVHTLEARAYDTAGQTTSAHISVTVSASGVAHGGSGSGSGSGSDPSNPDDGYIVGGCAAGGGGAGIGAFAALAIAAALGAARRRRARA